MSHDHLRYQMARAEADWLSPPEYPSCADCGECDVSREGDLCGECQSVRDERRAADDRDGGAL